MSNYRNPKYYSVESTTPNAENSIKDITERVEKIEEEGGGTTDYNALTNKPKVNDVELVGNKTSDDLHIQGSKPRVEGENLIF